MFKEIRASQYRNRISTAGSSRNNPDGEILPLTSIRGIAALLVVAHHMTLPGAVQSASLNNLIDKGYFSVDLFFVLSGFVMALTYARLFTGGYSWSAHRDFLWRRIARIYPLYIVVTLATSLYTLLHFGGYHNVHLPGVELAHPVSAHIANILMIHGWGFGDSIGGTTWSISTEWGAYLLFPLLAQAALFRGRWSAVLLGAIAIALLVYMALQPMPASQWKRQGQLDLVGGYSLLPLLRCLAGFSIGLLAYRLREAEGLMRFLRRDLACFALFILLAALMALGTEDLWMYPLLPLLILSLFSVRGMAARAFGAKPLWFLGVLSYSIYLIHMLFYPFMWRVATMAGHVLSPAHAALTANILTYAVIIGCSAGAYYFVELPGRRLIRRWTEQPKPRIATLDPVL